MKRLPLCFDFDGVIHSFKSGWIQDDCIPDAPNHDVVEFINSLDRSKYFVMVYSCRSKNETGINAMKKYCLEHGIKIDYFPSTKPTAMYYIDDHGWRYDGAKSLEKLKIEMDSILTSQELKSVRDGNFPIIKQASPSYVQGQGHTSPVTAINPIYTKLDCGRTDGTIPMTCHNQDVTRMTSPSSTINAQCAFDKNLQNSILNKGLI